jgi:hypothetical protein
MQTLMNSGKNLKGHVRYDSISEVTKKKLFGNLSITDVARCDDRSFNTFGVKGYEIQPSQMQKKPKYFEWPKANKKRFMDIIIDGKKRIPAPNYYENT